uniref:Uncharacterized protein n=1 Tax=Oryza nivara TaxID=4536 RepID=A0A0E0FXK2_ORYNI
MTLRGAAAAASGYDGAAVTIGRAAVAAAVAVGRAAVAAAVVVGVVAAGDAAAVALVVAVAAVVAVAPVSLAAVVVLLLLFFLLLFFPLRLFRSPWSSSSSLPLPLRLSSSLVYLGYSSDVVHGERPLPLPARPYRSSPPPPANDELSEPA